MAFAFVAGERVDVGARRLAREGAEKILGTLAERASAEDQERAVHDARRMLKRLRALARLVRGAIGDEQSAANALLRDAARGLSVARDATVMLQTFEKVAGDDPHAAGIRAVLRRARTAASKRAIDLPTIAGKIRAFEDGVDRWSFTDEGWAAIEPGVLRTYRQGRRALADARKAPESEVLHQLRKRSKDLQYQLSLLRETWPPVIGGYHDALTELGEMLGDDHDLAVLHDYLAKRKSVDVRGWLTRIDDRRLALRARIFPVAERIWFDKPRDWTSRFETWWANA